jgi:hypothetical protein
MAEAVGGVDSFGVGTPLLAGWAAGGVVGIGSGCGRPPAWTPLGTGGATPEADGCVAFDSPGCVKCRGGGIDTRRTESSRVLDPFGCPGRRGGGTDTRRIEPVGALDVVAGVDAAADADGDWAAHVAGSTQQSTKARMRIESQSDRSIIQPLSTHGFLDMMTVPDAPSILNHRIHRLIEVERIMRNVGP